MPGPRRNSSWSGPTPTRPVHLQPISGKRIYANGSGFPSGGADLTLNHGTENYINPDVAYNLARNEYLVVWEKLAGSRDIWAVRLTGSASQLGGGPFGIAAWPDDEERPAVAACRAADQYLVAWQSEAGSGGSDYAIYGRFVSGNGAIEGGPILIDNTTSPEEEVDIDCNNGGQRYLVAYQQRYTNLKYGITGRIILPNHSQQPAFEIVQPGGGMDRTKPAIAGGHTNYLVAWEHDRVATAFQDIHGRLVIPEATFLPVVSK